MKRMARIAAVLALAALTALAAGCEGGFFRTSMEGKGGSAWAGKLAISPAAATVKAGDSVSFAATGGDGIYTFSVVKGTGTLSGPLYTAPLVAGTERVRVADGAGAAAEAVITVKAGMSPDYQVAGNPAYPASGSGSAALQGSFAIENIAEEPGEDAVSWTVYLSRDTTLDPLDLVVDSGSQAALAASSTSASIDFAGSWPVASSDPFYYLLIVLASGDDANAANNMSISAGIAVTGSARPDYRIATVSAPSFGLCTAAFSQTLVIDNSGAGDGSEAATWTVYLSADAALDGTDSAIDSGLVAPGLASGASDTQAFSGVFPSAPGTYYFVARVAAFDDGTTGTKTLASAPITVSGPDYVVTALGAVDDGTAGQALSGTLTFTIRNDGSSAGLRDISWTVYASPGGSTFDAGDTLLASGTTPALAAGAAVSLSYGGTWPQAAGSYYLIARVQAADDATVGELASALVPVSGPDYNVTAVDAPTGSGIAGQALGGTFTIRNDGSGLGAGTVTWWIYASLGGSAFDAGDTLLASGTTFALASGAAVSLGYGGTWPQAAGSYYLIARVQAADDAMVGELASAQVVVAAPDVDYAVQSVVLNAVSGTRGPDQVVDGYFIYDNHGTSNGSAGKTLSWKVYASEDTTISAGDSLLDSGTGLAALGAGTASGQIPWSGAWPLSFGIYYIIVDIQNPEDVDPTDDANDNGSPISVGIYDETSFEPDGDYAALSNAESLGLIFRPGIIIKIVGTLNANSGGDSDDIFVFNTGSATRIIAAASWNVAAPNMRIRYITAANTFEKTASGQSSSLSLDWTVDTADADRWLDLDNYWNGTDYSGPTAAAIDIAYSCVLMAQ